MKSRYHIVKKYAAKEERMNSQILLESSIKNRNFKSIITKVLLQMLAKIGNALWRPRFPKEFEDCLMIGFDTHKAGNKNVLCGISTMNKKFS